MAEACECRLRQQAARIATAVHENRTNIQIEEERLHVFSQLRIVLQQLHKNELSGQDGDARDHVLNEVAGTLMVLEGICARWK